MGGWVPVSPVDCPSAFLLPPDLLQLSSRCLLRVYPKGYRIASENYNPIPLWNYGMQLVALNHQTPGAGEQSVMLRGRSHKCHMMQHIVNGMSHGLQLTRHMTLLVHQTCVCTLTKASSDRMAPAATY